MKVNTMKRTFLPSGMAPRAISTLAWARTSAEADMLTRKSVKELHDQPNVQNIASPRTSKYPPNKSALFFPISNPSSIVPCSILIGAFKRENLP